MEIKIVKINCKIGELIEMKIKMKREHGGEKFWTKQKLQSLHDSLRGNGERPMLIKINRKSRKREI